MKLAKGSRYPIAHLVSTLMCFCRLSLFAFLFCFSLRVLALVPPSFYVLFFFILLYDQGYAAGNPTAPDLFLKIKNLSLFKK